MKRLDSPYSIAPIKAQLPQNIVALTTTRIGGVSQSPFDAMNLGLHVGDEQAAVLENRKRINQIHSLPAEPAWLNQTHSTRVSHLGNSSNISTDADGAFTTQPTQVLAVLTADCLPLVICSSDGTQLAVVHAGWRGLANGIVANALNSFDSSKTLQAWMGPAIGAERFEVGAEVRQAFMNNSEDNHHHFTKTATKGKYLADLYALARSELQRYGCGDVSGGEHCTYNEASLFHSYRRDGALSGRMATLAWIRST